jgi:kynurenine formamidase
VVVRVTGAREPAIDVGTLATLDVRGAAALLHTGDDIQFGTPTGARFTATPLRIEGLGTIPVRAFARLPE